MYGKLFRSTFTGSMVGKGAVVFAVWGYAIAHTNQDSLVEINPVLIAAMIGCQTTDVDAALDFLCAEDPRSRSKNDGGKRLVKEGEFLYRTVNYLDYNAIKNEPARREYNRIKKRESRARQTASTGAVNAGQKMSASVSVSVPVSVSVEEKPTTARKRAWTDALGWFIEFKAAYPKRAGGQPWNRALKAARARIAEGHTAQEMIDGATRYAAFIRDTGKENTEYVKQAATFLGPDKSFLEPWTPGAFNGRRTDEPGPFEIAQARLDRRIAEAESEAGSVLESDDPDVRHQVGHELRTDPLGALDFGDRDADGQGAQVRLPGPAR